MFRSKVRIHTCKVILMTSLVWVMVGMALFTLNSQCIDGAGGWGCSKFNSGQADQILGVEPLVRSEVESKGRGILYEHLHDRGKDDMRKYDKMDLRRWRTAPIVPEQPGGHGEMGTAVHIPPEKQKLMKEKFKLNQFNLLASDLISLNRSLSDIRQDG